MNDKLINLANKETGAAIVDATFDEPLLPPIRKAVRLLGDFVPRPNSMMVIKPNLTSDKYPAFSGVTSDVALTAAVVDYINEVSYGCRFKIVESSSDGTVHRAFQRLGYTDWADRNANVELVNLDHADFVKLLPPEGKVRLIEVPELLLEMDYFINIAVLKRHMQERMSCIWKNTYGIPSNHIQRMRKHPYLKEILLALNTFFWPDLSIIDARVGLCGSGPFEGQPQTYNKLIVSKNPLAADIAAARLIKEKVAKIPTLRYAVKKLKVDIETVDIIGDPWQPIYLPYLDRQIGFTLTRLGLWLRRVGAFFERAGLLTMMVGSALRSSGAGEYLGGESQSLGRSMRIAWEMMTRVQLGDVPYE